MANGMLNKIKNIVLRRNPVVSPDRKYCVSSYSQEGEDRVLERLFEGRSNGFYIDIGAHHPFRFSNTYLFYKKGWRGINIDPMPGMKEDFEKHRPSDINLEIGISKNNEILDYYNFKETALNTFSESLANSYIKEEWELKNIIKIKTYPLSEIFDKYLTPNCKIDFMTIDIEGLELEVLLENDWIKYRPDILLVEILDFNLSDFSNNLIVNYLNTVGYEIIAKTKNTVFFKNI